MRRAPWLGGLLAFAMGCSDDGSPRAIVSALDTQSLEIHQVNVGWGSAVLIKGPDGTTVLLEAGNTGAGASYVVPYLQSIGLIPANGLGYTIAGHQHCDHIGGMDEVVNAGYDVLVRNYYNGSSYSSTCVSAWNAAAATTTAGPPVAPAVGEQIALGNGAVLTFVAVNGSIIGGGSVSVSDENDRSIAVLVYYGGFDYLWASDLGGGSIDNACTGRSTSQTDVETSVVQAISPGGAAPLISAGGIDVLYVNHHGSESSTNKNWMNYASPAVAVIGTGAGQSSGWDFPRQDVVQSVLLAGGSCITAPAALVLQTEEGSPTGPETSFAGYSVGNIKVVTDGASTFTVSSDGQVHQGPNETAAAGLPRTIALDDGLPPDVDPPTTSITAPANGATVSGTVSVTADAADDVGVTRVELWIDGALHASDTAPPYGWSWDTTAVANGAHDLYCEAYDAAGNRGTSAVVSVTVSNAASPARVIINEILANEPGADVAGEFVELANVGGTAIDIGGWKLLDATSARHTFAAGTTLAAGRAIVVFGGASAIPPALTNAIASSTGTLSLNNGGDTVRVEDAAGATIDSFTYPSSLSGTDGVSMNRNPDASPTGPFVLHTSISSLTSSPGKRATGEEFALCDSDAQCADGNACNGAEACQAGSCVPGTPLSCGDGNGCTADSCNPAAGCVHAPVTDGTACADGDACNGAETCQAGSCVAGAPLSCDDGNLCNGAETCSPATGCVPGAAPDCSDGNACTADGCDPATGCVHTAVVDGSPCSDGNACTDGDSCQAGACASGGALGCDDGNPCTDDGCNPAAGCTHSNNTASCEDGNPCTSGDVCQGGACTPGADTCVPTVVASDGFEAGFSGGTGWGEPSWRVSGDAVIRTNVDGPHSGTKHARLRRSNGSLKRTVSLIGGTGAHLRLWAKVDSFENGDAAHVKISTNQGASYAVVLSLGPANSDDQYHFYDLDIGACDGAAACEIFFDAAMSGTNDYWFVDDIEVTAF